MSDLLEKSLDEIIGSKKSNSRGRGSRDNGGIRKPSHRRGGRGSRSKGDYYRPRPRSAYEDPEVKRLSQGKPYVKITNLHYDLTEKDIGDLFSRVGEVLFTRIEFDTTGRSLGVGYVGFVHPEDASKAIEKFDGRKAAGKIISVSNGIPLQDRIGGGIGGSRSRGRGERRRNERPPKPTIEDLDAELDNYRNQKDGTVPEQQAESNESNNNGPEQQEQVNNDESMKIDTDEPVQDEQRPFAAIE